MNIPDKVRLWANEPLKQLSNHSRLVMNVESGMLLVQKTVSPETAEVYRKALSIHVPGVCQVYDVDVCDGQMTALCEYVNGISLDRYCAHRQLTVASVYSIVVQLCDALAALHAQEIVHRDIKPENIIVSVRDERVCLIDFGISRTVKAGQNSDTAVLGTVGYAAPEQFGFGQTDRRTDIYALGVLLNVLLENKMPCEKMHTGIFHNVVLRCTQQNPSMRYPSVQALKTELMRAYAPLEPPQQPAVQASTLPQPPAESGSAFQRFCRGIPGFRTHNPVKMTGAIALYLFMGLLIYSSFTIMNNSQGYIYSVLISATLVVFPFLFITDAWGILSRRKVFAGIPKNMLHIVQALAVLICFILLGIVILIMPESVYGGAN